MAAQSPPPLPEQTEQARAAGKIIYTRLAIVIGVVVALAFGAWWLATRGTAGTPLRCLFHDWTGLHCPGCGMTRAASAFFQGHLLQAFAHNPLGVILLPIAMLGVSLETIGWVRGTRPPYRIPLGRHGYKIIAATFLLFFLFRNLPWKPFTYLAP